MGAGSESSGGFPIIINNKYIISIILANIKKPKSFLFTHCFENERGGSHSEIFMFFKRGYEFKKFEKQCTRRIKKIMTIKY